MNLLILDAGHAKNTAGKRNEKENFYEWQFNNDMQHKIKSRCEDHNIKVYLTNPNPATVSDIALGVRAKSANDYWIKNNKPKSIFISLHANAFSNSSARGTETYHAKNASNTSKSFAKVLNDEIVEATVKAICSYFNIEYKEKVVKKDDNLYAVCVGAYKDRNKANAIVEELKKKGYTSTYLIIR